MDRLKEKKILIIGFGGIGRALYNTALSAGCEVDVLTRQAIADKHFTQMDLTQEGCVKTLTEYLKKNKYDIIINTIGLLSNKSHQPENTCKDITNHWLAQNIKVNVMPSIHIIQALSATQDSTSTTLFVSLSAEISSISTNKMGNWYSYKMSKCMLNMLLNNSAKEWSKLFPKATIIAYHPGTVDTPLSKPFARFIPKGTLISAEHASELLLKLLSTNDLKSGALYGNTGEIIDF